MVRIKICGIRNAHEADAAVEAGADVLGFNFWTGSQRYIKPSEVAPIVAQLPRRILSVGVFVDESPAHISEVAQETGIGAAQLHGSEPPEYLEQLSLFKIKAIKVDGQFDLLQLRKYRRADLLLLEGWVPGKVGGTGQTFDWTLAEGADEHGRIIVAGGLNPQNVGEAVRRLQPWGVDVASGVESAGGNKDPRLIQDFINAVRAADTQCRDERLCGPFKSL